MTALKATELRKCFGAVSALDGFDLEVAAGEIAGLVGHNGAGKTTFARVTAGLVLPDTGSVQVLGVDVTRAKARADRSWGSLHKSLRSIRRPRRGRTSTSSPGCTASGDAKPSGEWAN